MDRAYYLATANDTVALGRNTHLGYINVSTAAASAVVTIYEGASTSDPVRGIIDASSLGRYEYDCAFGAGLFIKLTGGNAKVTVTAGG